MHMNLCRCNEQKVSNEDRNHGKVFVVLQPLPGLHSYLGYHSNQSFSRNSNLG